MGSTVTGHRCLLGVTEAASEDQPHIETWLSALAARGVRSDQGLLCMVPGGAAVPAAVRTVWGPTVAVQQCLNATLTAVTSGLSGDQAVAYRHRLRLAWMRLEVQQAEEELHELARTLTTLNRSAGHRLQADLEDTLTVQRTGRLLAVDRGVRVMSSVQRLTARLRAYRPPGPADQRLARITYGLWELEPHLRRLAKSPQLGAFRTALQQLL